tara:strand:- start:2093 stop:2839 length:747 start_codon:yes stop_codon:yes gene_type:complete
MGSVMKNKVGIVFIGTNKYIEFFPRYYQALESNFLENSSKTYFVFTDQPNCEYFDHPNINITEIEHQGWPYITLYRFKFMAQIREQLADFDWLFFIDADLIAVSPMSEEELLSHDLPLIGVQHPGFIGKVGSFETNPKSLANIFDAQYDLSIYRQGCFWGGKSKEFLDMIVELERRVDVDLENDIVAVWHDESQMNKYFLERNDQVYTLHAGYATPQSGYDHIKTQYETKFLHLFKDQQEFPRFARAK